MTGKKLHLWWPQTAVLATLLLALTGSSYKPIALDRTYNHDKYLMRPADIVREFRAYVVSFDGPDDDDGNGTEDRWGIPEWVAYEIKQHPNPPASGPPRPDWFTDPSLSELGIAPTDATYHFTEEWRNENPTSPQLGYDRGHMCMKLIAFRLGADADWNTHIVLNACPQKSLLNQGIWLDLERKTAEWADQFGRVWVVCGPVINGDIVKEWLGQDGEMKIAIPDAFFKIVIKESATTNRPDVLAFIYPQEHPHYTMSGPFDHTLFLKTVDEVEQATGLDFLTLLPDPDEAAVEAAQAEGLWE